MSNQTPSGGMPSPPIGRDHLGDCRAAPRIEPVEWWQSLPPGSEDEPWNSSKETARSTGPGLSAPACHGSHHALKKYLLPSFGPRPIDSVTRAEVGDWWTRVLTKGLSRERLSNIQSVAGGLLA